MTTGADKKKYKAKELLQEAIRELQKVPGEWGWDGYNDDHQDDILECTTKLIKIKRRL